MDHKLNKTTNDLDNESVLSSIMIDDDELINLENGKKQETNLSIPFQATSYALVVKIVEANPVHCVPLEE